MAQKMELAGQRFGNLVVIEQDMERYSPGIIYWKCKCDCGKYKSVRANHLTAGNITSCGCGRKKILREKRTVHGMRYTPIYRRWIGMRSRCNGNYEKEYYADRGIGVCERWEKFENFYEDMKDGFKPELWLDRIDNNKGYCKENCRWVTVRKSNQNRRCVKHINEEV